MPVNDSVELQPITSADVDAVAAFLHENLNRRVSESAWAAAVIPPWEGDAPNHGFMLWNGDRVVGVHLALYSQREVEGRPTNFCNLAAWCVLEEYRAHGVRLLLALVAQKDYHFTDLSPGEGVVRLNTRLNFRSLDTATALVPNVVAAFSRPRFRIVSDPRLVERLLGGRDLQIFRDHMNAAAVRHLVVTDGAHSCYVVFRRDRWKGLPVFASILYVGDHEVFQRGARALYRHLLVRRGYLATLAELRIVDRRPALSVMLRHPYPKMFKSPSLKAADIDYLYSELACVSW